MKKTLAKRIVYMCIISVIAFTNVFCSYSEKYCDIIWLKLRFEVYFVETNFNQYIRSLEIKKEAVPSFSKYPFSLPAIKGLSQLHFHPKVTFFVGENGTVESLYMNNHTESLFSQFLCIGLVVMAFIF